jgi:anti-sigma factor RsiW
MNCELAHERIVTAAYGELPDEQIHELERHMTGCPDCHSDREQLMALKLLADAHPVMEPPANLVARSRLRLEEALDALPPKRWYERLTQRMTNNFASIQAAPMAACLLLVVGGGAGTLGSYEYMQTRAAHAALAGQVGQASPAKVDPGPRQRLPASPALSASPTARLWT